MQKTLALQGQRRIIIIVVFQLQSDLHRHEGGYNIIGKCSEGIFRPKVSRGWPPHRSGDTFRVRGWSGRLRRGTGEGRLIGGKENQDGDVGERRVQPFLPEDNGHGKNRA